MTDLNLAGLRENLDRLERNEAWPVDPPHLLAVLDRLEAAEGDRDRLREALKRALFLLDAIQRSADAPADPPSKPIPVDLESVIKGLGIRDALVPEEGTT